MKKFLKAGLPGLCAGAVGGFFGAGGGMVLVPLLEKCCPMEEDHLFPSSLAIMAPICTLSLLMTEGPISISDSLPFLLGSFLGGLLSSRLHISPIWLHRLLGLLVLFGGIRLLFP